MQKRGKTKRAGLSPKVNFIVVNYRHVSAYVMIVSWIPHFVLIIMTPFPVLVLENAKSFIGVKGTKKNVTLLRKGKTLV